MSFDLFIGTGIQGPQGEPGPAGPAGPAGPKGDKGDAATVAVGETTTLPPGSEATVVNSGTESDAVFDFGIPQGEVGPIGPKGDTGNAATVAVGLTTTLPAGTNAFVNNVGTEIAAVFDFGIPRGDTGETGAQGPQGIQGVPGENATIAVGTVTTVAPNHPASIINSGTAQNAVFNFEIPQGETGTPGNDGNAATIQVGSTQTLVPGSEATVTNSGTANAAVFDFGIPRGDVGPTGPQGEVGPVGPIGPQGNAATIAVGDVVTGAPGSSATVTNVGTENDAVFDFQIPRGDTGATGPQGTAATVAVGTTTTVSPSTPAAVVNVGTDHAAVLNFEIPQGIQGTPGLDGDRYQTTSTTELIISNGLKTLTIGLNLAYTVNQVVQISFDLGNFMTGDVVSYDKITGTLVVDVTKHTGAGTHSSWIVNLSGAVGAVGPQGPQGDPGTPGVVNAVLPITYDSLTQTVGYSINGLTATTPALTDYVGFENAGTLENNKTTVQNLLSAGQSAFSGTWVSGTTTTITHNLGTKDVMVNVYDLNTGNTVVVQSTRPTINSITLTASVAPSVLGYSVQVFAAGSFGVSVAGPQGPQGIQGPPGPVYAVDQVLTVGVDAPTVQGCIDLCTDATTSKVYVVQIPPKIYIENLTLKGCVHLRGLGNPRASQGVTIKGHHTHAGNDVNPLNNRITLGNILLQDNDPTIPILTVTATTATEFQISGCYLYHSNAQSTSVCLSIGANVSMYMVNCFARMTNQAGTIISQSGGALYGQSNLDFDNCASILNMTAPAYAQLQNSQFIGYGANLMTLPANGVCLTGGSAWQNLSANGNGFNLAGAGAVLGSVNCYMDIVAGASNYVVTGSAGSVFISGGNSYGNVPGVQTRNVKIKNTVTPLSYATTLAPSA